MSFDEIRKRILEAEKIDKQSRPEQVKRKWRTAHCPNGHKIEYLLKVNFTGELKCVECGVVFKVPSLNGFVREE